MKSFAPPSKSANVRESLHQHLHMYALAASAAGVSVLALAQPGEAEIVYTPVQVTIAPGQRYNLDLNQDGIVDFTLKNHTYNTTSGWFGNLFVQHPGGNAVAGHIVNYGFPWAYALRSGMRISKQNRHFTAGRATMAWSDYGWFGSYRGGSWVSNGGVTNRYLGLKFKIDGKVHYGWARLSVQDYSFIATLTGFAYETIPDKLIKAGAEQETENTAERSDAPVLSQPTLGHLAQGARSLRLWRQNQQEAAEENK
jgi:hypothetical protein